MGSPSKAPGGCFQPLDIGNSNDFVGRQRLMSDAIRLALETDSTRFVSYHVGGSGGVVSIPGVAEGYHTLSYHGLDEDKLALVEAEIIKTFGRLLRDMNLTGDSGTSLVNNTSVLLTSTLGNASSHDNRNMPVVPAGGRFKHGQHLAFDRRRDHPLPNVFVNLLQQVGLQEDRFASNTGTATGLETM
ncbi:MAG: DUF1552 domain-containing protein [Fuerstiella sp.]|nr:DUF1552 domain-containing protein [Fuerstiella sp.]